jgi:hypothetical protein
MGKTEFFLTQCYFVPKKVVFLRRDRQFDAACVQVFYGIKKIQFFNKSKKRGILNAHY